MANTRPSSLQCFSSTAMACSAAAASSTFTTRCEREGSWARPIVPRAPPFPSACWRSLDAKSCMSSRSQNASAECSQRWSRGATRKLFQAAASTPGTSWSCTTVRIRWARPPCSRRLRSSTGPTPGTLTSPASAASKTRTSVPCLRSRAAAFFGPIPGTPGMLSQLSPVSANRSLICSGFTPKRASTPAWSRLSAGFNGLAWMRTLGPASCMRSLSTEMMCTGQRFEASLA
mmetsp:Transcript_33356/g.92216  ORF Transcript_33356/g.92216 Transcript_33356/m.92216 type:complete len:231 (+) Transcript_33356:1039-1731(+)